MSPMTFLMIYYSTDLPITKGGLPAVKEDFCKSFAFSLDNLKNLV